MVFPDTPTAHAETGLQLQVATAGEALMDMIEDEQARLLPCAGGAVYNLTRALGLQGVGTLYLNPLSADRYGRLLATRIHEAGVTLARPEPVTQPTSLAVVGLDGQGKASYSFYREGVADRQVTTQGLNLACQQANSLQVVATGCLALVADDSAIYLPWLQAQRATGRLVVVDANLRPAIVSDMATYRASVLAALGQAHLVKASDDDLSLLELPGATPLDKARHLLTEIPATWAALTLGAEGAVLLHRDGRAWHARETAPVVVADTVGAGDCFLAGLLVALLECESVQHSPTALALTDAEVAHVLAHAVASASLCVQQVGCVPPNLVTVRQRVTTAPARVHPC